MKTPPGIRHCFDNSSHPFFQKNFSTKSFHPKSDCLLSFIEQFLLTSHCFEMILILLWKRRNCLKFSSLSLFGSLPYSVELYFFLIYQTFGNLFLEQLLDIEKPKNHANSLILSLTSLSSRRGLPSICCR